MGGERENPGIELLSQPATQSVSSPLSRFTIEFGMESKWFHNANNTRKYYLNLFIQTISRKSTFLTKHPQDCIEKESNYQSLVKKLGQALGLLVRLGYIHY